MGRGEWGFQSSTTNVFEKSGEQMDRRGPRKSIELKGDVTHLHEDSFVSEPTAKVECW